MNPRSASKAYALATLTYHHVERTWRVRFSGPIAERAAVERWEERHNKADAVACAVGDAVGVRFSY